MAAEKISLYNLADLKNTSDDALPNYLNSLKFKQSHYLTDVRLALGWGAFAIAAACFGWDYKFGFDNTKYYTAAAVLVYAILNGCLTLWVSTVEKGTVYQGKTPSGDNITIRTVTKKNDPTYYLTAVVEEKASAKAQTIETSKSFGAWFDETGRFVAKPFQEFLATSVAAIGKHDLRRVKPSTHDVNPELLDAVLAASAADGSSTAAEPVDSKGGKRRKA